MSELIYFDNNATTKPDNRVIEEMIPFFTTHYGNASSKLHEYGWIAEQAVDKARNQVASLIGAEASEIIFTSGATESINTALIGIYNAYKSKGNHIITVETEHMAVLETCKFLQEYHGAEITYLPVNSEGLINADDLILSIKSSTILICIMSANNETGVVQPIELISEIAKSKNILFFSDATQYIGKNNFNVNELGIDATCLSAHKFFGPKGIGALYLRRKNPQVNLVPLLRGGSQERGRRGGTLNVPLIVGLGKACELAEKENWDRNSEVSKLRAHFEHQLLELEGLRINGTTKTRLYNTSNITFPEGESIIPLLKRFAFSSGSACASSTNQPSHVLKAMGLSNEAIRRSFRFSFSHSNTLEEVNLFLVNLFRLINIKNPRE